MLLSQQRINLIGRILLLFKIHSIQYISIFLQAISQKENLWFLKSRGMHYFRLKNNITKGNVIPTCVAAFFFLFNITATKISPPQVYKYLQSIISRTLINCVPHVPQIETHFLQKKLNKIKKNCCFSLSWCFVLV